MRIHKADIKIKQNRLRSVLVYLIVIFLSFLAGIYSNAFGEEFISSVVENITSEIRMYQENSLPTIFLDIPYDSLNTIQNKRDEALYQGILLASDDDFVPASMRVSETGENIQIKLRLKGDLVDHLIGEKWSFRIHISEDNQAFLGMRRFSLQAPETRTFLNEWGYHQNLILEGVLATRYHFVNIILNGEHKGVYAVEESFTEDLLENQGRREGVIFRLDEDVVWETRERFFGASAPGSVVLDIDGFFNDFSSPTIFDITSFRDQRIAESEVLSAEAQTAYDLMNSYLNGNLSADQVLDEEAWGKFLAITDLWAANHATSFQNLRMYYNPITSKIEPVGFDALALNNPYIGTYLSAFEPKSGRYFFSSPGVMKVYIQTLQRIIQPEYLASLENTLKLDIDLYYAALQKEYQEEIYTDKLSYPWETLSYRGKMISTSLNVPQFIRGGYSIVELDNQTWIELSLINLMEVPVEIQAVKIADTEIESDLSWGNLVENNDGLVIADNALFLNSGVMTNHTPVTLMIPLESFENLSEGNLPELLVANNIIGRSGSIRTPVSPIALPDYFANSSVPQATLAETLSEHEFLYKIGSKQIGVVEGDWDVNGDLVIPQGYALTIPKNTTLRFQKGSALISFSPLLFTGSEDEPILLTAQDQLWSGIVVIDAGGDSRWEYVKVENTEALEREGWILTGGVTFYKSSVHIYSSIFESSSAEDAINIVHSDFYMDQVEFSGTLSDAFDGDFTIGEVNNSSFHDIGGDGIDYSGSEVIIQNCTFVNIADKAISIGENSDAEINKVRIEKVGIGVASKDLSTATITDAEINQAKIAGIAAYIKKAQYGPATVIANSVVIEDTQNLALSQTGNYIELNSVLIPEVDLDVEKLYELGIVEN